MTKRYSALGLLIAAAITAILIASYSYAQPGIGITKTAPLSGAGSVASPLKITACASGESYLSNGTTWACAVGGDILGVTAGAGLTGGGTSGTPTLDVGAGTGISVAADAISLNMTGATCGASEAITTLSSVGTGTCTTVGDITSAGATSNMGLTGGATSGASLLGLLSTCSNGQVLKSGSSGTTWTCAADDVNTGDITAVIYTSGGGMSASGTTTASGDATVGLRTDCDALEVLKWNPDAPNAWQCYDDNASAGDIEGVTAGTNITGGGTSGTVTINVASTVSLAGASDVDTLIVNNAATGQTTAGNLEGVSANMTGSMDATGGARLSHGVRSLNSTTRSAGANTLTNYAFYASALNGQANWSFYGAAGLMHNAEAVTFGTTLGVTGAATLSSTANVTGALTVSNSISTTGGSGNLNVSREAYFGSVNQVYLTFNETSAVNYEYSTNGAATGRINAAGYQGGTTQFRSLDIENGKGSDIVTFDGASKHMIEGGTAPTLTSCGGSPTIIGDDKAFTITIGSAGTGCVATFATTYGTLPTCVMSAQGAAPGSYIVSATAVTISSGTAEAEYDVICWGH